jgi:DNA-binding XRE family transcriptional regulator
MEAPFTIETLRRELGLNQADFAGRIGLANKASVSLLERGGPCSLPVALAIEALSAGRIDAADLNQDVKAARHAVLDSSAVANVSPGKVAGNSRL